MLVMLSFMFFIVILRVAKLSVIMQSVLMLSVIMLSVIILSVVASLSHIKQKKMLSFILEEVGFVASGSYYKQ
jgi:hypothetical protein